MSIASRITAIEEHIRDVYDTIDYSYDTTDVDKNIINIPQNIFNGYINVLNDNGQSLWNNLTKVSQADVTEAELSNVVTAPMKISLKGNTLQDGEPTPDTPVDVQVVTGENVVSVSGKNLFDKDNQAKVQVNVEGILRYGLIVDAPNKKVSISAKTWGQNIAYKELVGDVYGQYYTIRKNSTIEIEDKIIIYNAYSDIQLLDNNIEDLQIEINDIPTPYVPYSKTDYPINLGTLELCKIGDYKDYLFKRNGKWYVHKEIMKVVLDGTENWPRTTAKDGHFRFRTFKYTNGANVKECYSNNFKYNGDTWSNEGINAGNVIWIRNDELFTTESDLKTWLSTHNTIVYYVLATPTEEEITNATLISQLETISKAKSVKDKTYITQTNDDLPFILDVQAIKEYEVN